MDSRSTEPQRESWPEEYSPDRRFSPRVVCRTEVTLSSESTFYMGFTENISSGGLFVATHSLMPIGHREMLEFTIPGRSEPIRVHGEVRWLRIYNETTPDISPGMGFRFLDLAAEDAEAIEAFVAQREPLFYDDE